MENLNVSQLSSALVEGLVRHFGKKCSDICVKKKQSTPFGYFLIDFALYDYFIVICELRQGHITFSVPSGTALIRLKNVEVRSDQLDLKALMTRLDAEILLRIPDKYLQAKGWMS